MTGKSLSGMCKNKTIDSHIYTSTYDVRMRVLLNKCVLVHIRDENGDLILLPYVSTLYTIFFHISNDKYKWIWVDTIYYLISNFHLCYIHHISNGNIFVTQYEIMTKHLSAVNTTSVPEISSTAKS